MRTESRIAVRAPLARVLPLAMETERWPQLLPHYRFVRILEGDARRRTVEMAAYRPVGAVRIPVRWRAVQENAPEIPEVRFQHIAGWTRGMEVWWRFRESGGTTEIVIEHRLHSPVPLAGKIFTDVVVGRFFVDAIAARTLERVKALAEQA